ncbi:MAG: hypothetical protein Kow0037_31300 [Calditrichia bacterium]
MDLQNKNKLLTILVGILIILNILTIGYMWYGYLKEKPALTNLPSGYQMGNRILARELDLSAEQARQIAQLREGHFSRTSDLMQRISQLRDEMAREALSDSPDTQQIRILARQIGQLRAQMEEQFFLHINQIRGVCSPEQRQRCDQFIKRMLRKSSPMNRPGWKRHRRGGWGKQMP